MVMANAVDQAILTGSGGLSPLGIVNQTGVTKTAINAAPDYADLVDAIERLETSEIMMDDSVAWIFNPKEKATFRKLEDTAGHLIWTDTEAITRTGQVGAPSQLLGHRWIASTNVIAGTNGNSSTERNIFFGKWNEVIVGMRQELEIRASDEAGDAFAYDQTWIRAILRMDVVVAHPEGIEVLEDVSV
jgi:HK97 family phage major capsid protein